MTWISLTLSFSPSFTIPAFTRKYPVLWFPLSSALLIRSPTRIATLTPTPVVLKVEDALAVTFAAFAVFANTSSFPLDVVLPVTTAFVSSPQISTAMAAATVTLPSVVSAFCGDLEGVSPIPSVPEPTFLPLANALLTSASGLDLDDCESLSSLLPELSSSSFGAAAPLAPAMLTVSVELPLSALTLMLRDLEIPRSMYAY